MISDKSFSELPPLSLIMSSAETVLLNVYKLQIYAKYVKNFLYKSKKFLNFFLLICDFSSCKKKSDLRPRNKKKKKKSFYQIFTRYLFFYFFYRTNLLSEFLERLVAKLKCLHLRVYVSIFSLKSAGQGSSAFCSKIQTEKRVVFF